MRKKHAIGRFIVIAILCAVALCLTIFSFSLPGDKKDYDFVGFARAINLGVEFQGGTVYEYKVESNSTGNSDIKKGINSNVERIKYLLRNNNYNVNVYKNSDDVVVELLDEYTPISIDEIINADVNFAIKTEDSDTAEAVVSAEDVNTAVATMSGTDAVLYISFTKDGANNFQKVIDKSTAYFYIGSTSKSFSMDVSSSSSSYIGIKLTNQGLDQAKYYASQIVSSKYDLTFSRNNTQVFSKDDANRNTLTAILLTVGLFVLCTIILCALYKKLGLVGSLILLIGLMLQIIILQAIPENVFVLTGPALFASLLCLVLGGSSLYLMFNKMHNEYKAGKILYASVKFGYDKIWTTILDTYLVLLIPSVITYFFSSYLVKQFTMALMCGLAVYSLVTLLLTRFMSRWLTNISFKNKDYGFKREAHVDELK